jgi:nicotinamide riboside transporter PnuC
MSYDQILLLCFSGLSIFFISGKQPIIGFCFGLFGQPLWFYTSWTHGQYAIVILSLWYTFCHWRGIRREYRKWFREKIAK